MSHYSEIKTKFRDQEAVIQALVDLGFKREHVEVHDQAVTLSTNAFDKSSQKAHIVVRRQNVPGHSYTDMGFVRQPDGTLALIADDMSHAKQGWVNQLTQRYNLALDVRKAKAMGYHVTQTPLKDGSIRLRLVR